MVCLQTLRAAQRSQMEVARWGGSKNSVSVSCLGLLHTSNGLQYEGTKCFPQFLLANFQIEKFTMRNNQNVYAPVARNNYIRTNGTFGQRKVCKPERSRFSPNSSTTCARMRQQQGWVQPCWGLGTPMAYL